VTFIRYNGTHLCKEHFTEYVERRVKREIRRQRIGNFRKIAVALSGGKDSSLALYLMHKIFSPRVEIHSITVDEGIVGYREKTISLAKSLCNRLKVPHHIVSFKETMGLTMDEIAKRESSLCTYCGVFRRATLNREARRIKADVLVMGHNLDDFAQSILMNFVNADLEKLARLGPHERIQEGLVPRLLPLKLIPEKECFLYAILNRLPTSMDQCPYAFSARARIREMIDDLEEVNPGTRHSIVQSYDVIKPLLLNLFTPAKLKYCKSCGEPTVSEICKACSLLEKLRF
jgi:uncharacterized protein (TIGR00269 family)